MMVDQDRLKTWAAQRCAAREYAQNDMRQKLLQKGASVDMADEIVQDLVDKNFINDQRFTQAYVSDKINYDLWGKNKIKMKLRLIGIDDNIIDEALAQIDPQLYQEQLLHLLQNKVETLRETDDYIRSQKLLRYAAQRGFDMEDVFKVIEQL